MTRGVRRGCVRLRAAVIGIDDEDDSTFTITVDHKTFHFQCAVDTEKRKGKDWDIESTKSLLRSWYFSAQDQDSLMYKVFRRVMAANGSVGCVHWRKQLQGTGGASAGRAACPHQHAGTVTLSDE
ncbi:Oxysterol-binding protein-related protein 9 [Papilio xuthus]|uniref:Oxysterol-binding protein-related protein 9 n=1 Tax=Papilio xuthus TaxID=66420 RepID=A0A0N1IN44_PAPXU|nr:Oxysterol-binding protein-related protein 9 [Papilio xuthus]